jgi:peptide/nickel transport system permease protein
MTTLTPDASDVVQQKAEPRRRLPFAGISDWVAVALLCVILIIALFGSLFAPHAPTQLAGVPYSPPSGRFPLGTDFLGRDVLSRVLYGGRSIVLLAGVATALAYLIGAGIGLMAGYNRAVVDAVMMRVVDVMLAFPPILLLLLFAAGLGPGYVTIIVGVTAINIPGIARVVRGATLSVSVRGYVEAAVARGERTSAILTREILPNIVRVLVADGGIRFASAILSIAGLNFLGLGLQPPAADWATMIAENREGITLQPWAVAAPAVLIAALALGANRVADAVTLRLGESR